MRDPNHVEPAEPSDGAPAPLPPEFIERHATKFEWRHARGVALIRGLVAAWLIALGTVLVSYGQVAWGVVLYLVALVIAWLAFQMPRWQRARAAAGVKAKRP